MTAAENEDLRMMEMHAAVAMAKASLNRPLLTDRDVSRRAEEAAALFDKFLGSEDRVAAVATYNQLVAFAVGAEFGKTLKPILIELAQTKLEDFTALAHHLRPDDAPLFERVSKIEKMLEAQRNRGPEELDL
jgi:hypothetical protein